MPILLRAFGPSLQAVRLMLGDPTPPAVPPNAVAVAVLAPQASPKEPEWALMAPAEEETDDDLVVGPPDTIARCEARLETAGVKFDASRIPVHEAKGGHTCGAPQVVRYRKGPQKVRWGSGPKVTCGVALGMARFEAIVQEEARRIFGREVVKVQHMGTYNCREMAAYPGWVSEHAYANAIDIKRFVLAGGKEIAVLGGYGAIGAPRGDGERFLQAIATRAYDENVFSVVLTPAFDRAHRNHFHLDLARYRVDGTGRAP